MERRMFDTPVLPRLATVLAEVKAGELAVPVFQRPFVWDDNRRLLLLDSIEQGMPIGSLLVWRTSNRALRTYEDVGGVIVGSPTKSGDKISYLIDGHQRVSTLFAEFYRGFEDNAADAEEPRPIYYDLESTERPAFRVVKRGSERHTWLPLHILFNGDRLFEFTQMLRVRELRDLARKAENLANIFRDYIIPIVPLVTEDLNVVTDAFVRINTMGKGMTEAHMLRALTHLELIDTEPRFEALSARLEPYGWGELGQDVLVKVLKALLHLNMYDSNIRQVLEGLKKTPEILDSLEAAVVGAASSPALASVGVLGPSSLPYDYQFVAIAAVAAQDPRLLQSEAQQRRLRRWMWGTTYADYFSGMPGSRIRDSFDELIAFLSCGSSSAAWSTVEFSPLRSYRASTARSKAFVLFLAQRPSTAEGKLRRQELLAGGESGSVSRLFPRVSATHPGNVVLASPDELRIVRNALKPGGVLDVELRDALGIPDAAVAQLPDVDAFVEARRVWLEEQERAFVASLATE